MATPNERNKVSVIVGILVLAILAYFAFTFLTAPDNRTATQRVSDAVEQLPDGPGAAVEQLEDRTPAERAGDAIENAADRIENSVQ